MSISLRRPSLDDLECYYEIFSDQETHHFIIDEGVQDIEGSKRKLNKLIEINGNLKRIYTIADNHTAVGFIVTHLDDSATPFISYAIRRTFWKKGLATNALKYFLSMDNGNLEGVKAATHLNNTASQKLLKKLKFLDLGEQELEMGKRRLFEYRFNNVGK